MKGASNIRGYKRYEVISYLYQGDTIQEVSKRMYIPERTIRLWVSKYNAEGITGLAQRGSIYQ